jgi:transcriptional regulator with XRE-family HTH domain
MSKEHDKASETFRKRLKSVREGKARLTQSELAAVANLSTVTISKLEQGVNLPTFSALIALCEALEVSPNTLLGWTEGKGIDDDTLDSKSFKVAVALQKLPDHHADALVELIEKLAR